MMTSAGPNKPEQRTVVHFSDMNLPNVEKLGRYEYKKAQKALPPHRYSDRMEICYLAEGKQIYQVKDEQYTLVGGDVLLTFPGEIHGTGSFPEEKGILYWLILKVPQKGEGFLATGPEAAQTWLNALTSINHRFFQGSSNLRYYLDKAIAYCEDKQKKISEIGAATYLSVFLIELLECARQKGKREVSIAVRKAVAYINNHLEIPIKVEKLAEIAGLSTDWFKEKFRAEMGQSPADFVNRCKIEYSKQLLQDRSKSVTDVAYELGFSSSQYFSTVFKRYAGQTPTGFREKE